MEKLIQGLYTGERALYDIHDKEIIDSTFEDGESPLKECSNLRLERCIFKWKYPMWYSKNIVCENVTLLDTARSGIWYTDGITISNSFIQAPKQFRRSRNIAIINTPIPNAEETLWNCENITIKDVDASGDYIMLNCNNIKCDNFKLNGNYAFDGSKNIEISNSFLLSKDSFWNTENVIVRDSVIIGEYLGWNSKNLTFINCTIDSLQGMCYMENVRMENCKLLNTNLSFERCKDVYADIASRIDSIKNPYSGYIKAVSIGEIILDEKIVDPSKTTIITEE